MKVVFHPDFPTDQRKFQAEYAEISVGLAAPTAAGHFINTGSKIVPEFRRRNLNSFPFFVLYGCTPELLIFGAIIATRSDPLNWLTRFRREGE
jgi:hypothetical protein